MCAFDCIDNLLTDVCPFIAYIGNLVASLTKPARTKALNTFEDLLHLPNEASVFVLAGGIDQFMKETSDPILKVCNPIIYNRHEFYLASSWRHVSTSDLLPFHEFF